MLVQPPLLFEGSSIVVVFALERSFLLHSSKTCPRSGSTHSSARVNTEDTASIPANAVAVCLKASALAVGWWRTIPIFNEWWI